MQRERFAAALYGFCAVVVITFQMALAAGARWAPVAFLLFATSLIVARVPRTTSQRRPPFSPA